MVDQGHWGVYPVQLLGLRGKSLTAPDRSRPCPRGTHRGPKEESGGGSGLLADFGGVVAGSAGSLGGVGRRPQGSTRPLTARQSV